MRPRHTRTIIQLYPVNLEAAALPGADSDPRRQQALQRSWTSRRLTCSPRTTQITDSLARRQVSRHGPHDGPGNGATGQRLGEARRRPIAFRIPNASFVLEEHTQTSSETEARSSSDGHIAKSQHRRVYSSVGKLNCRKQGHRGCSFEGEGIKQPLSLQDKLSDDPLRRPFPPVPLLHPPTPPQPDPCSRSLLVCYDIQLVWSLFRLSSCTFDVRFT